MKAVKNAAGSLADVRAWARTNGHEVSDRGQIPQGIIESYAAAVREWGRANGFNVGQRGRLSQELLNAFNASMRKPTQAKSTTARPTPRRTARQAMGARRITTQKVREAARAQGYDVGDRGRLPTSVIQDFMSGKIRIPENEAVSA